MGVISVRAKILAIILGFFTLIAAAFGVYSAITTDNYRRLRTDEITMTIAFESEQVNRIIAEMERNAVDLALAGRQYFLSSDRAVLSGVSVVVENFSAFDAAVGGGIWFEPYTLDVNIRRVCYYAFFDNAVGVVRHDPGFMTEEYDYHTQMWYKTIAAGLESQVHSEPQQKYGVVWTKPYIDDAGTNALMTTVGAGIYDDGGRFVGMSTVDWEIQSMVDRLSGIKPTPGSFVLLASPHDNYIISDTQGEATMFGQPLRGIQWLDELSFESDETVNIGRFIYDGILYLSFSRVFGNGWLFSVLIPASEIFAQVETLSNRFTVIIAVSFIAVFVLTALLLYRLINRPLSKLTSGVAELGGGNLDKHIDLRTKDEFGTLAQAFNKMTVDLKKSIEQSARERAEKERIGTELDIAANIQASMLPRIFPPFPDHDEFDLFASMKPAREVGGDFYDFFVVDNKLWCVMADVSGKGVPAALFMAIGKTLIKNAAQSGQSPGEAAQTVNDMLCEGNDANLFITAFIGSLDIKSGLYVYANAGHILPLIWKNGGWRCLEESKPGLPLAVFSGVPYAETSFVLDRGERLFMFTDGITEASNANDELYGYDRLLQTANSIGTDNPREFSEAVMADVEAYAAGAEQSDDITMLTLVYTRGN